MTLSYAPYPQTVTGSLGDVGLGALTYPSWIPQTCVNCSASTLERWKTQIAFAMGWYDIFRNLEKFPTAAQAERFKRFGSYASFAKPGPAIMNPNDPFWSSTPERLADHADIVKQALRHGSFHSSTSFTPGAAIAKVASAITHSPVMLLVNPADAIVHKIVGDKTYYAVAKAIGGDKVEAALKAGNNSLADLSKGKTRAELVSQGLEVAKVAAQEKLTPEQVNAVLASLPPETAQAARDALAGKAPTNASAAPAAPTPAPAKAPLRTLDPPKRPAAPAPAVPAKAPLKTLDPPKRAPATSVAPTAQASAATPGAPFVYAPYPQWGALSAPPPHGGHGHGGGGHGGHGHGGGHGGGHVPFVRGGGGGRGWWGVPWNYEVVTTTETCRTWGDPVPMALEMLTAARTSLGASGGRPTTVRGPDGVLYLFSLENGSVTARPCAAVSSS